MPLEYLPYVVAIIERLIRHETADVVCSDTIDPAPTGAMKSGLDHAVFNDPTDEDGAPTAGTDQRIDQIPHFPEAPVEAVQSRKHIGLAVDLRLQAMRHCRSVARAG